MQNEKCKIKTPRVWQRLTIRSILHFTLNTSPFNTYHSPFNIHPIFAAETNHMLKVVILCGGQLGRMLLQAAANYTVETFLMENDPQCPAAHLCHHFIQGDIRNFEDVYNFGRGLDAITIEIESVNED